MDHATLLGPSRLWRRNCRAAARAQVEKNDGIASEKEANIVGNVDIHPEKESTEKSNNEEIPRESLKNLL